jgi:hypothetical protein
LLVRKKPVSADCASAGTAGKTAAARIAAGAMIRAKVFIWFLPFFLFVVDQPNATAIIPDAVTSS